MSIKIHEFDGRTSLFFATGGLDADDAVFASGHEPNGYFWEGLVEFAWPHIADRLKFDCEAGTFVAIGARTDLELLRDTLNPVLADPATVRDLVEQAEAAGFEFDD